MGDRACAVVVEEGKLLMVRQTYRGQSFWTFPGGAIEPGETPEGAAVREVQEETGLAIRVVQVLSQRLRVTATGTYFCYLGRVIEGQARLGLDPELPGDAQELHDLHWFSLDDIRDYPEVAPIWTMLLSY
jgi:8-oxo-dGTP diphosphatase